MFYSIVSLSLIKSDQRRQRKRQATKSVIEIQAFVDFICSANKQPVILQDEGRNVLTFIFIFIISPEGKNEQEFFFPSFLCIFANG